MGTAGRLFGGQAFWVGLTVLGQNNAGWRWGAFMKGCPVAAADPSKRRPVVPVASETVSWTGVGRLYGNGVARKGGFTSPNELLRVKNSARAKGKPFQMRYPRPMGRVW
jgi:hypothetical protein